MLHGELLQGAWLLEKDLSLPVPTSIQLWLQIVDVDADEAADATGQQGQPLLIVTTDLQEYLIEGCSEIWKADASASMHVQQMLSMSAADARQHAPDYLL